MTQASLTTILTQYRLYLLGRFRLEQSTRLIHFPTRKIETLLAYLVLHSGLHTREKLAALLWGDFTDAQARASLRNALATLRKHLGDNLLLTDREAVQFNIDYPLWVDTLEFEQIRDWKPENENEVAISHLESLTRHYQGDLLANFYDDWIFPIREQYRRLYLETLLIAQ